MLDVLGACDGFVQPMIVGWSMADHMKNELVSDTLQMAIARRSPEKGYFITATAGFSTPATITCICYNRIASSQA